MPLLAHTVNVIAAKFLWPEGAFDEPVISVSRGVMALSVAALASPYVFAPRPFARAVDHADAFNLARQQRIDDGACAATGAEHHGIF